MTDRILHEMKLRRSNGFNLERKPRTEKRKSINISDHLANLQRSRFRSQRRSSDFDLLFKKPSPKENQAIGRVSLGIYDNTKETLANAAKLHYDIPTHFRKRMASQQPSILSPSFFSPSRASALLDLESSVNYATKAPRLMKYI